MSKCKCGKTEAEDGSCDGSHRLKCESDAPSTTKDSTKSTNKINK